MTKRSKQDDHQDDDDSSGGQSGSIEFREFITYDESLRDDLPISQEKQLLREHQNLHAEAVKKQKVERDNRKSLKEGKKNKRAGLQGGVGARNSNYPNHPVLSRAAQFSGTDKQVTNLPSENVADTNQAQRDRLADEYQLRHAPKYAPQFNPKPNNP